MFFIHPGFLCETLLKEYIQFNLGAHPAFIDDENAFEKAKKCFI